MNIDFEQEFEKFTAGNEGSAIADIYNVIPSLTNEQMQILDCLQFYVKRYGLTDLEIFINQYLVNMKQNKSLSFLSSMNMKSLLKAYTQDELIRGIKISSNQQQGN